MIVEERMRTAGLFMIVMVLVYVSFSIHVYAKESNGISIDSESAILIDAKTGITLYGKNSNMRMYPASITKIVTAIVAIEEGNLEDLVVVSKKATYVEGTRVYLEEGEEVTLEKLIHGLLINSGNDAAIAIAEHIDGSVKKFAERMTEFVSAKAGASNTSFQNPHGLHDSEHYTTAADMAKITRYAMKNKTFAKMFNISSLPWNGESWETTLYNHHKMIVGEIPYEGIIGGKNGYVQKSGYTLVTVAKRGETSLIAVTLKTSNKNQAYRDTKKLLDYGFENFNINLLPKQKNKKTIESSDFSGLKKTVIRKEKEPLQPIEIIREQPYVTIFVSLSLIELVIISFIVKLRSNRNKMMKNGLS
jgi:serine-type D-Ala-D-Ala carboxypeptidase (penicillin-binding protein 5/6)